MHLRGLPRLVGRHVASETIASQRKRHLCAGVPVESRDLSLSFGGSGLLMLYQFGAASKLSEDEAFMSRIRRVHGTSGGAIAALILLECPELFERCADHYASGAFFDDLTVADVVRPHRALMKRTMEHLGLLQPGAVERLRGRLLAHASLFDADGFFALPANVALEPSSDDDVFRAISASCCIDLSGVRLGDETYFDGGLSDPLPFDLELPTVQVSAFIGDETHIAPGHASPLPDAPRGRPHPILRYDWSLANVQALVETGFLTRARAQARYDQGRRDAAAFLACGPAAATEIPRSRQLGTGA